MHLSVVIPLYKSSRHLPGLVNRLSATAGEVEIVFVDDASGDGTLELARELAAVNFPEASQVVALPKNLGVFGARNHALDQMGCHASSWVCFLDDDTLMHPDWWTMA